MNTAILRTIVACCLAMMMIMFSRTDVSAQGVPQAMNYQAAVRDSLGLPLADKDIGVRISILRGSSSGEPVYVEQHHVRTDDLGLFVVAIGRGESKSGAFGAVDWSARDYWLKIDVDVHGGTDFIELGAQQLYSVPFALMAERSRYSDTAKVALRSLGPAGSDGDSLAWKIGGNRGIDPEHNFIGTADSADFIVRTNGKIRFIIGADGSFHVGDLRPVETNMVVVSDDSQGGTLGSRPLIDLIDMAVLRKLDSMLFADPLFIHHIISRLNIDLAHDSVFIREVTSDSLFVSRLHHTINSLLLKDSSFITSLTRHLETLIRRDTMRVETIVRGLDTLLSRDSVFIARLTSDSTFIERLETIGERFFWSLTGSTGTDPSRNFLGTRDSRPLAIRTDNVERMRVDGNGNVGIGTVAPTERLHVAGNIRSEGLAGGDRRLMVAQPDGRMAAPGYVGDVILPQIDTALANDPTFVTSLTNNNTFITNVQGLGDSSYWSLTGSAGLDPSRNFLGTTDNSPLALRTNDVERMRVDAAGNVGIGTAAPEEKLHVAGDIKVDGLSGPAPRLMVAGVDGKIGASSDVGSIIVPQIDTALANDPTFVTTLTNNNTFITNVQGLGDSSYWSLTGSAGLDPSQNFLGTTDNSPLALRTNDVERMRVDAAGNVGIGTATPEEKLHVAGDIKVDGLSGPAPRLMVAGVDGKIGASSDVGSIIIPQIDTVLANDPTFVTSLTNNNTFITNVQGLGDSSYWSLTGSAGLDPSQNFLGTTDNSPLALRTNDVERMRVDATGNVGIGTATPEEKLHVAGDIKVDGLSGPAPRLMVAGVDGKLGASSDVGPIIVPQIDTVLANDPTFVTSLTTSGTFINRVKIIGDSSYWSLTGSAGTDPSQNFLGTTDNSPLALRTNDVERMRVDATGNVGIGTATPEEKLHVAGDIKVDGLSGPAPRLMVAGVDGKLGASSDVGSIIVSQIDTVLANDPTFVNAIITSDLFATNLRMVGDTMFWALDGSAGLDPSRNFLGTTDNSPLALRTGDVERLRIDATGNVGIGTATPGERLHLSDGNVLISNTTNTAGELRLQEPSGSGSNYIALRAPSLASNVVFTLPASLGTANTILTSDGAGGLSWTDPSVLVGSSIWGVGGNTGLTNPNFGTLDDQPINFITGSGGPNVRLRIDANGNVGIGTTAPQHRLHVVNDSTGDELAAVYGVATQSATDQAIGLWGDASGTDAGNTGTIGVLATGNGSTSVGATNAAIQINDGEIRVGRTTETGTGYTPVEGAAAGISYTAEGPSGVIEVANLGGLLGTLGIGQSLILNHMPVNNRYVKPNSIILLQVINASGLTLGNLLNLTFSTLVDDRTDGSFMVSVSAHYAGLLPLVLGVTDAVRIGYVVINPAQ